MMNASRNLTDSERPYLTGKILTGKPQDTARMLATIPVPPLEPLAREEVARLRGAYKHITGDGKGIDVIGAFGEEIGIEPDTLAAFMPRHSVYRGNTYLSDPYLVRDLFGGNRKIGDTGGVVPGAGDAEPLFFRPATTWSKPGDAVFRFTIMFAPLGKGSRDRHSLRVPVFMLDSQMLDVIERHDGPNSAVLRQLHEMMSVISHDYLHMTFLNYDRLPPPQGMQDWDDQLRGGKPVWRYSESFVYNYEVLATIGHRKIMERIFDKHPEFKKRLIDKVSEFSHTVDALSRAIRASEPDGDRLALRMERYLMSNYMRLAYHALRPDEPKLAWIKKAYPYIEEDLNMHTGKGLVSILHQHQGVPGRDSGDSDITFRDWLNPYVTKHMPLIEREGKYMKKIRRGKQEPTLGTGY